MNLTLPTLKRLFQTQTGQGGLAGKACLLGWGLIAFVATGISYKSESLGFPHFVETQGGGREEIVRKTAWQWGPEAVTACLCLAHFTLVGRHRMLWSVSLETGQLPTIFRKRRFLGLGGVFMCMCACFLGQMDKGLGLEDSGWNLTS